MTKETFDDEELEEDTEEAGTRAVIKSLEDIKKRYKDLFGNNPDDRLPIAEIQNKIVAEMTRRNLRPYKL